MNGRPTRVAAETTRITLAVSRGWLERPVGPPLDAMAIGSESDPWNTFAQWLR